jgi:hypothetical protein
MAVKGAASTVPGEELHHHNTDRAQQKFRLAECCKKGFEKYLVRSYALKNVL